MLYPVQQINNFLRIVKLCVFILYLLFAFFGMEIVLSFNGGGEGKGGFIWSSKGQKFLQHVWSFCFSDEGQSLSNTLHQCHIAFPIWRWFLSSSEFDLAGLALLIFGIYTDISLMGSLFVLSLASWCHVPWQM